MEKGVDYIGVSVAFLCHDGQGNFVLHQRGENARDEQGTWEFGGGGVKFGETIEQALRRELNEEYGCTGEIEFALPPESYIWESHGVRRHWITHSFFVKVNREEVKINEPEAMSDLGWFTIDSLPQPLHPGVIQDLETYKGVFERYRAK